MNGVLGCFIMAMPFTMILILYVIPSELSCDLSKLTILYNLVKVGLTLTARGPTLVVRIWRL